VIHYILKIRSVWAAKAEPPRAGTGAAVPLGKAALFTLFNDEHKRTPVVNRPFRRENMIWR